MNKELIESLLRRPNDFGYNGDNDQMFRTWTLGPVILTRDSDINETVYRNLFIKYLEENFEGEFELIECNHWACGWVEHLTYKVIDEDGNITEIANLLNDMSLSNEIETEILESDEFIDEINERYRLFHLECIESYFKVHSSAPDDWAEQILNKYYDEYGTFGHKFDENNYPQKLIDKIGIDLKFAACLNCCGDGWNYTSHRYDNFEKETCSNCNGTGKRCF